MLLEFCTLRFCWQAVYTYRWESQGIRPFLQNQQLDSASAASRTEKRVGASEILRVIEEKYTLLKLMVKEFSGDTTWQVLLDVEKEDLINQVKLLLLTACKSWRAVVTFQDDSTMLSHKYFTYPFIQVVLA